MIFFFNASNSLWSAFICCVLFICFDSPTGFVTTELDEEFNCGLIPRWTSFIIYYLSNQIILNYFIRWVESLTNREKLDLNYGSKMMAEVFGHCGLVINGVGYRKYCEVDINVKLMMMFLNVLISWLLRMYKWFGSVRKYIIEFL